MRNLRKSITLAIALTALSLHVYAAKAQDSKITLIKNMEQSLLVQHDNSKNAIKQFYNDKLELNGIKLTSAQLQQQYQAQYQTGNKYQIEYRYFTVDTNSVSWFENVKTTTAEGRVSDREILKLAIIREGKISEMFAGGI
jgi:hypothetical protein